MKYFNKESHKGAVYEQTLGEYQGLALKAASSLSAFNFGQNAIFSIGLTIVMYLTLRDAAIGRATIEDLVLVNGLLFQLNVPLNFIGWVYQKVRQAFEYMEAMFQLQDTKSGVVDTPGAAVYDPGRCGTTVEFAGVKRQQSTRDGSVKGGRSSASRP